MRRSDFRKQDSDSQFYYDFDYDKDLIEASFAAQYGIRLRHEPDICLAEFLSLLSGLNGDTPLGQVVAVRMESNPEIIKKFGNWERRMRSDWGRFKAARLGQGVDSSGGKTAQEVFKQLFG